MAKSSDNEIQGWGVYFDKYVSIPVVNKALGGRSARSYTTEGHFAEVEKLLTKGDIAVIEFGHNDGGSPEKNDNGRSDCPGVAKVTCKSSATNQTVYTFNHYIEAAAKNFIAKGAAVIISSQTPNNPCESGDFDASPTRFVGYAAKAAKDTGATYINHYQAVADKYKKLGCDKVNKLYPNDHTHTNPDGADLVAQAFVQAVADGNGPLRPWLKGVDTNALFGNPWRRAPRPITKMSRDGRRRRPSSKVNGKRIDTSSRVG